MYKMVDPIFKLFIQSSESWILNQNLKIGLTAYTYPIELIFSRATEKIILKLINGLDYPCGTQ